MSRHVFSLPLFLNLIYLVYIILYQFENIIKLISIELSLAVEEAKISIERNVQIGEMGGGGRHAPLRGKFKLQFSKSYNCQEPNLKPMQVCRVNCWSGNWQRYLLAYKLLWSHCYRKCRWKFCFPIIYWFFSSYCEISELGGIGITKELRDLQGFLAGADVMLRCST